MTDRELQVVMAMKKYGGGFVTALAEALRHADHMNFPRLKAAFPDYWAQYEKMTDPVEPEDAKV
jgi:hypothetical protein